jgi:hypothetical protein
MKQSIIGEIYASLTKGELKKLNKFISTSHWSKSETIQQCHSCLASYASKEKLEQLTKEILFSNTYPKDDYNDNKLRFTLNRLIEAIKEFILLEENEKKNVHSEKIWMDFIQNKKLKKNILLNIENDYNPQGALNKFIFQYYKSVLNGQFNFIKNASVEDRYNSLMEMTKSAEAFADFEFLRQYSLLITFSNVYKSSDLHIVQSRYNELKQKTNYKNVPEFDVYFLIIELLTNPSHEGYYNLKDYLFKNSSLWDMSDHIIWINYLLNYSTSQINKGDLSFIDEQYQIYNFCEENYMFNSPDFLTNTRINNVTHIYLRKKDFLRAEKFIEDYVVLLPKEIMDSCRHFNLARIRFEKKMYKESLRELLQVDFGRDAFYSINSKVLLLKNYFELKESDALASLVVSFKEYIKKNKIISEAHKISIINYLKMVDKIYGATSIKAKKLDEEIKKHTQIAEKSWLLEKIEEKTK